jgi:hypothetical protein
MSETSITYLSIVVCGLRASVSLQHLITSMRNPYPRPRPPTVLLDHRRYFMSCLVIMHPQSIRIFSHRRIAVSSASSSRPIVHLAPHAPFNLDFSLTIRALHLQCILCLQLSRCSSISISIASATVSREWVCRAPRVLFALCAPFAPRATFAACALSHCNPYFLPNLPFPVISCLKYD